MIIIVQLNITIPGYNDRCPLVYKDLETKSISSVDTIESLTGLDIHMGVYYNEQELREYGVVYLFNGMESNTMIIDSSKYNFGSYLCDQNDIERNVIQFIREQEVGKLLDE